MKKYILGLTAIVFAAAFSAFTTEKKTENLAPVYWVFDSQDLNDAQTATAYSEHMSSPSCESGNAVPCVIELDETADLQTYLNTFSSPTDVKDNGTTENRAIETQ